MLAATGVDFDVEGEVSAASARNWATWDKNDAFRNKKGVHILHVGSFRRRASTYTDHIPNPCPTNFVLVSKLR